MLIPEWECDTFANAGSIKDGVYPDTLILVLTRLSCFNVKTNYFILKIWKNYFGLKMIFCQKKGFGEKKNVQKIVGKKEFSIKKKFG